MSLNLAHLVYEKSIVTKIDDLDLCLVVV